MGDQPDSWARRKREIGYSSIPFIFSLAICTSIVFLPISRALGIEGSVSYIWEERKREEEEMRGEFTQVYDLILSRRLRPLYDASLKFEFRSETKENEKDREKTQLLPSLNMRMGNDMTNLNMGWSEDVITDTVTNTGKESKEKDYTHERAYMGFNWRPKWLPHILWQFQGHKRKESHGDEPSEEESDDRITFIEEYTLRFGPLILDHNFDHEIRKIDGKETTNYDLLNRGNISHRFSFFEDRLYMSTGYELIQDREKENEDKDTIDTWKHHVNFNLIWHPVDWMKPGYKAFWGDIKTDFPDEGATTLENDPNLPDKREITTDKRETTLEHDLTFLFMPHPYFSSTLGMYYNRLDKRFESLPGDVRELETFSIKMEPQVQGLIFDPNISMYPIMTSILMSSSTEKNGGSRESRTLSLLFTGATTIYQGVDFDLDLSLIRRKEFLTNAKRSEERVDSYLKFDLLPNLKGSINQKAKWTRDRGENIDDYFEGDIETRLIYRPVRTFMFDVGYKVDYDDRYYEEKDYSSSSWQCNVNWRPASKMELDLRYQSRSEERKEYFLGELNLYMTQTIHLELRYQSPSEDHRMKVEFNMRF